MTNINTLVNHLEANAREELAAQERFLELLDAQERAIVTGRSDAVEVASQKLESEFGGASRRAASRTQLVRAVSNAWGVPATAMTLGSIAERAGQRGERLALIRNELRDKANQVANKNRRVAAVARLHHQVVREVINTLFCDEQGGLLENEAAGTLIDAEA